LALGFLLGAAALFASALFRRSEVCAHPGTEECAFDEQTTREVSRLQLLGALGCALVGSGLSVAARRRPGA
jgi:hypothetical protein